MVCSCLNNKNILIVDDNEINQYYASSILKDCRVSLTMANDGSEACELLSKNTYDLILMDLYMPNMNGIECIKTIRNTLKIDTPIIVVTAGFIDLHPEVNQYVDDKLNKPYKPNQLKGTILKHMK